jgi:hypothetical protein
VRYLRCEGGMSLRLSGFWCDGCNKPMVTEMFLNKPIKSFTLTHFQETFHYHDECKDMIAKAVESLDPSLLPAGSPVGDAIRQIKEHNAKVTA